MSSISSNVLFHFTDSIHNLADILSDEFRPHYSLEDFGLLFEGKTDEFVLAFPLISFCDIPLSQASKHMATYGNYALGLRKEWGLRNGIAPVLYAIQTQPPHEAFRNSLDWPRGNNPIRKTTKENPMSKLVELSLFLKPYEGPFFRRGRLIPNVRFYDEREWRFVPTGVGKIRGLLKTQYLDFSKLKEANDRLRELAVLKFEPSDIRYIVVGTEAEILPMIQAVERIKQKYSADDVKILTSRIVSATQILEDF